jgi:hypothetical protein
MSTQALPLHVIVVCRYVQGKILGLEGDAIRKVTSEYKQREDTLRAATESGEYLAVRCLRL